MTRNLFSPDKGIVSPAARAHANSVLKGQGLPEDMLTAAMAMNTPPALRSLPDSGVRGQKSLGRIQQINKARRFKSRMA
jgi:hypothetical protein